MSSYITERDMLEYMETGKPFSLTFVTYDRKRKTGGKPQRYAEAILVQPKKEAAAAARRSLTPAEARAAEHRERNERRADPNHRSWYTRNIRILQDGQATTIVRKIHPPLVLEFNKKRVVP